MRHAKSHNLSATGLTSRGLMVGIPLVISMAFSGLYFLHYQASGKTTAAGQTTQSAAQVEGVKVVTPPKADKLSTEETGSTKVRTSSAQSESGTQSQSTDTASTDLQNTSKKHADSASKDSADKLQPQKTLKDSSVPSF